MLKFKRCLTATALIGLIAVSCSIAQAETMQSIIDKGKLIVGVKTDYAPWGMRNKNGKIVGLEIDLANDVAKRLSAKAGKTIAVELVPVVASNRMQFLQQGQIDLMIATMNDKPERRKVVGILLPNYYSSGVTIMARKNSGIKEWSQIKGKNICAVQGVWYNREWGEKYGANLIAFPGTAEAEKALLDGRCVGWLYDDSAFVSRLTLDKDKFKDFEMATPVVGDDPWAIAVRLDDRTGPWGSFVSAAIVDWLTSGKIEELEKKWGIPPTKWVREMTVKCKAKDPSCRADAPY